MMNTWRGLLRVALALLLLAGFASARVEEQNVLRVDIPDPASHWLGQGFVALTPAIRASISPGSETIIYLRVPEGAVISTRSLPEQGRTTLILPPGSVADRVAVSRGGAVEDVRGTSWNENGAEFFHVYRPMAAGAGAPLAGYAWRRDAGAAGDEATRLLVELMQDAARKSPALRVSRRDIRRFRSLNQCQTCHQADKPMAADASDPLPPWATDGSGLYVPLAVMEDSAPLSNSPDFDDPNADDRFVSANCKSGAAKRHEARFARWFTCADGSMPMGRYDLGAALAAGEAHARDVCASRRYIFSRLDAAGAKAFEAAMKPCRSAEIEG